MNEDTKHQMKEFDLRIKKLEKRMMQLTPGNIKLDHQPLIEYPKIKMFKEPEEVEAVILEKFQAIFFERLEYKTGWGRNELKRVFEDCIRAVKEEN